MAWQCKGGFNATWMPEGCLGGERCLGWSHRTRRGRWEMTVCHGGQFFQELQPTHSVVILEEVAMWGWSKLPPAPKLFPWLSCMFPHCVSQADHLIRLCICVLPLTGVQWWDWLTPAISSSMYLRLMFLKPSQVSSRNYWVFPPRVRLSVFPNCRGFLSEIWPKFLPWKHFFSYILLKWMQMAGRFGLLNTGCHRMLLK